MDECLNIENTAIDRFSDKPCSVSMTKIPALTARDSECSIGSLFKNKQSISLNETNRLAKMLSRIDNKYVLTLTEFKALLNKIGSQYAVLEIKQLNQFSYSSCYYDDEFGCYFEHHQARRQRFKVRTREYVDSGLKFFEVKLKGLRGLTNKHRMECDFLVRPSISGQYLEMLHGVYLKQYKKQMPFRLRPSLIVNYKRCTLVALSGGERVTIDYQLSFDSPDPTRPAVNIGNDFIIVETKSKDGKGITDRALKKLKIRKASKCSKYCIGLNLTGEVTKNNNFLPTIRHATKNIIGKTTPIVTAYGMSTGPRKLQGAYS